MTLSLSCPFCLTHARTHTHIIQSDLRSHEWEYIFLTNLVSRIQYFGGRQKTTSDNISVSRMRIHLSRELVLTLTAFRRETKNLQMTYNSVSHIRIHLSHELVFTYAAFRRETKDLRMTMRLSLKEALLGFERTVDHLDGHVVNVKEEGTTQHGQVYI